ncbi:MAG: T9SS type A sorting domain-containing protein [Bacteroidota bacterium]
MKKRIPVLMTLLLAFAWTAAAQVQTEWARTVPLSHPDWFGSGTERGLAYGVIGEQPRVFVVSRSETPNVVRILDAETGADAGSLSSTGIEGGYLGIYALNDVGVSDDGVIFAGNMTLNAGEEVPFRVYRWNDEASDPELVIDYTDAPDMRLGDRLTVVGSASDNSLQIYAAAANGNRVVRFTTEDQGQSFAAEVVTLEGIEESAIFPNVTLLGDGSGDFIFNAGFGTSGIHPRLHRADGSFVTTMESIPTPSNTVHYFEAGGQSYLAVNDGVVEGEMTFSIFEINVETGAARLLVQTPSLGNEENTFGAGDMDIDVQEDSSFVFYGLAMNNGVGAFRIDPAGLFQGTFYVGAEGTAPGGADPDYASLSAAFAEINDREPSGPITLLITSDLDERGSDVVLSRMGLTEDTPVVVRPAPETAPTITVGAAAAEELADAQGAGIALVNVSYVTIDGSSDPEADSRDLTIVVNDETADRGIGVQAAATSITIRNLTVLNENAAASAVGIRVRRDNDASVAPENVLVENVQVGTLENPFKDGIAFWGTGAIQQVGGTVLDSEVYAMHRGLTTFINADQHYRGNRVVITGEFDNPAWFGGVYLAGVENATVAGNEIHMLGANTAEARHVTGIVLNVNVGEIDIFNNMIYVPSDFQNIGTDTANEIYGIGSHRAGGEEHHRIYHNTIRIGDTGETGVHAAFGFPEGVESMVKTFDVKNNIFVNERDHENAFAIDHRPTSTTVESDFNNLYVTSSEAAVAIFGATRQPTLSSWQFASGLDANSVSKAVEFAAADDLRLTGDSVGDSDLAGTPLAVVETDIDGTPRDPEFPYMGAFEGAVGLPIEDGRVAELPGAFELHQNYPNPFNPSTTISYTLHEATNVTVRVFNAAGQLVQELVNDYLTPGKHEVRFEASDLASGVYMYQVQAAGQVQTRQMVLVK